MAKRIKSAIKQARASKKRRSRNLRAKDAIKNAFKSAEKALSAKAADVQELIRKAVSVIDKAAEQGIIHKNKASRKKSRLMLKFNEASGKR